MLHPLDTAAVLPVCRYLRTKQSVTVIDGQLVPWQAGENAAASYWCLATSAPVGPDEVLVHPHDCVAARACYRPPKE